MTTIIAVYEIEYQPEEIVEVYCEDELGWSADDPRSKRFLEDFPVHVGIRLHVNEDGSINIGGVE